ncbi:MAG: hypothetical protein NT144_07730, partial [Bacteroidia bacterium]|nr:hypothetical protein [Bacteroidia bacterium]
NDVRSTNDAKLMTPAGQLTAQPNDNQNSPILNSSFLIINSCIPSLISLLVMALISFPFYSLTTLIVFFFLAAIISSHVKTGIFLVKEKINFNSIRLYRLVLFLVLVLFSALLLMFTRQQYKTYYTYDEAVMLYQTGIYEEACKTFSEVYIPLQYTGSYLQYYGKALSMNEEYPRGVEMLERAAHFTSDEILYTTLGDTYKALKRYSEAEEAYLHASFMVPHKLYPRYLLANLYSETGQKEKALRTAEELLNKKIKVESTATEEIRQAMRKIIEKIKNGKEEFNSDEKIQIKEKKKIINE